MSQSRSDARHHTASRVPASQRHHIPPQRANDPASLRTTPHRWSTKTITVVGIGVSAVVTLAAAFGPRMLDSNEIPAPIPESRDGSGDLFGALGQLSSLTHLSALVTLVDPDELDSWTPRIWEVDTVVTSPDGTLEVQVPQEWSVLDEEELPSGVEGRLLIGWSQPEGYGFVEGGEPGIAIASIDVDNPTDALAGLPSPSKTCPASAAAVQTIALDPTIGTGAVRVYHGCKEDDGQSYVWFQVALTLVPLVDEDAPATTDVLTMSVTSPQDLTALAQILASTQVSAPERGLSPSGSA